MKEAGEFPLGSVPVWIEDGEKICQSNTVLRMVGNRCGLYSNDPATAWAMDSVMEQVEDNMGIYAKYMVPQIFGGGKADQAAVD